MLALGWLQLPVVYSASCPAQVGHIAPAGVLRGSRLQGTMPCMPVPHRPAVCRAGDMHCELWQNTSGHDFQRALVQGCGKTTTCMKYAHFHKRKGFKPAMVCADTFRSVL